MRAKYCAAFVNHRTTDEDVVIVVPDPDFLAPFDLADGVRVVTTAAPPAVPPSERLARSTVAKRVIGWARGGSRIGARVERNVRVLSWRLRHVDRAAVVLRAGRRGDERRVDAITTQLREIQSATPITQLVAFDAFDLPIVHEFAESRAIRVVLR